MIRIDIIDGRTSSPTYGNVVHQLFQRDFHKFQGSAKKIAGSGYFAHEPVRLKFQVFLDSWIDEHLLSDSYEHDRGISHFEAKVFDGNTLIYWGVIDTSVVSYDYSSEVFEVTLYDRLRLLKVFEDLVLRYYWATPWSPDFVLSYFAQQIMIKIDIDLPFQNNLVIPSIEVSNYPLVTIDYNDFAPLPDDTSYFEYDWFNEQLYNLWTAVDNYIVSTTTGELVLDGDYATSDFISVIPNQIYVSNTHIRRVAFYDGDYEFIITDSPEYPVSNIEAIITPPNASYMRVSFLGSSIENVVIGHYRSWSSPTRGYRATFPTFVFGFMKTMRRENHTTGETHYKGFYKGYVYHYYNKICPVKYEYNEETDWLEDVAELNDPIMEFYQFFKGYLISPNDLHSLEDEYIDGTNTYGTSPATGIMTSKYTGNVLPERMVLKMGDNDIAETEMMGVLKAMLLMYNATIIDVNGTLTLANKSSFSGDPRVISTRDIVKMTKKRVKPDSIDFTLLKVLMGDTTVLGEVLQQHYSDLLSNQWTYSISIDDMTKNGPIELFSKVQINGQVYGVTEVLPDRENDEYRIVGWAL